MTEKGRQKDTLSETVHKELRVVLSRSRSPLSLRVAKWLLFLGITRRLYGTRWFWAWILGLPLAGVATHLLYRHKTRGWRRPWGGWRDVEAANPTKRQQGGEFPRRPYSKLSKVS
jgi:predicted outer membrane lipoprotein